MRPELESALQEIKAGTPEGVERALASLQQTVFSFSLKACGHRQDAEDTAQETLVRTVPQLAKFESPQALAVWLYKVARSRCLMSRRRSKFAPQPHLSLEEVLPDRAELASLLASGEPGPEQHLLRKEDAGELRRALLRIPPGYRQVLVLHDMEELTTREVARITGLREGTVRVRLHRARAFLRNELAVRRRRGGKPAGRPPVCKTLFAALSDYLDHQIEPGLCAKLEAHLDGCAPCQAYLASLEETVRRCRRHCSAPLKRKLRGDFRQMVARALTAARK
jgi:RNA polymerase sigma-70 factor (ECF subfamily)